MLYLFTLLLLSFFAKVNKNLRIIVVSRPVSRILVSVSVSVSRVLVSVSVSVSKLLVSVSVSVSRVPVSLTSLVIGWSELVWQSNINFE